jgi:hypothetical protein
VVGRGAPEVEVLESAPELLLHRKNRRKGSASRGREAASQRERETERQTDRRTDRQTDRQRRRRRERNMSEKEREKERERKRARLLKQEDPLMLILFL